MNKDGLCVACDQARHMFCDGAGQCECDLCVPFDLRGVSIQRSRSRLIGTIVAAALIAVLSRIAHAQMTGSDFCQSPNPAKSSAAINCSGTGECKLVAAANQQIQVCALVIQLGGTSPTAQFDYGTKASTECDTGTTHLTGALPSASGYILNGPLDYFTAPAGNELCVNLGGTSPTAVGVLTYVQK